MAYNYFLFPFRLSLANTTVPGSTGVMGKILGVDGVETGCFGASAINKQPSHDHDFFCFGIYIVNRQPAYLIIIRRRRGDLSKTMGSCLLWREETISDEGGADRGWLQQNWV